METATKLYVAGKFEDRERIREAMNVLELAGYQITHDWTQENAAGLRGTDVMELFQGAADKDLDGVLEADALVLFHHPRGRGSLVEFGAALARNIPVIVVGGQPSASDLFYWHENVIHAANVTEVLDALRTLFPDALVPANDANPGHSGRGLGVEAPGCALDPDAETPVLSSQECMDYPLCVGCPADREEVES